MAVYHEEVRPAIVVKVDAAYSTANVLGICSYSRSEGNVVKRAVSPVVVEDTGVRIEIRFDDVQKAVTVVVARCYPHAALLASVFVISHARQTANFGERAVVVVVKEQRSSGIVRYVNVGPAVVVIVEDKR